MRVTCAPSLQWSSPEVECNMYAHPGRLACTTRTRRSRRDRGRAGSRSRAPGSSNIIIRTRGKRVGHHRLLVPTTALPANQFHRHQATRDNVKGQKTYGGLNKAACSHRQAACPCLPRQPHTAPCTGTVAAPGISMHPRTARTPETAGRAPHQVRKRPGGGIQARLPHTERRALRRAVPPPRCVVPGHPYPLGLGAVRPVDC